MSHNTWIHRIARLGIRPLTGTRITPNQVTTLRLAVGVAAAAAFAEGGDPWRDWGAGLFLLSMVLDRADGELARLTGTTSAWGHKYDLASDALCNALAFFGLGFGLRASGFGPWGALMGLVAGLAIAAVLWLVMRVEAQDGPRAGELGSAAGFDADDALLIVPLAVWLGLAGPLIVAASLGAPLFALFMLWIFRRRLPDVAAPSQPLVATGLGVGLLVSWVVLVRRYASLVLLLATLATGLALGFTLSHLRINTSTTDMLSEELPFRQNSKVLDQAFPQLGDTLSVVIDAATPELAEDAAARLTVALRARPDLFRFVFYPDGDPFFRRNGLLYHDVDDLALLADRLAEAQPLLAWLGHDPTLRGLAEALQTALTGGGAAPALATVLEAIAEAVDRLADGRPRRLSWQELITGEAAGPTARRKLISVQPRLDFATLQPAARALDTIRALARDLGLAADGGVTLRITGSPAMLHEELASVRDGMGLVGLLSLALVIALLAVGLRSSRLILGTLAALVMGLAWTALFATAVIGELNLISVAFAVLFIGLSVDFGIHFALRYKEAVDSGVAPPAALEAAVADVGGALSLCAVAAAIGFAAFLPTEYRGISELGLISGAGMFIALFANLTVLPAVLSLLPLRPAPPRPAGAAANLLHGLVERHARIIVIGALLLGLASLATLPFARFDDNPLNLRDRESESVATLFDLLDDPRVQLFDVMLLAADLDRAGALAAAVGRLPEVAQATTVLDLVPRAQDDKLAVIDEMALFLTGVVPPAQVAARPSVAERRMALAELRGALGDIPDGPLAQSAARLAAALDRLDLTDATLDALEAALIAGLPGHLAALAEALAAEPVSLPDLPAALRARLLADDGRAIVRVTPSADLLDPVARRLFVLAVQSLAPGAVGAPITITEAGQAVVRAFRQAALTAVVLIALLLLAVLRSLRDSLAVLAPLLLAALLTVAATVLLAMPFNFANVIVLPLLFGLGVASGIHVVTRGRAARGAPVMRTSTPRAVAFSALTTIGSFGALALSSHPGTASMGVLLTIAIGLTLLATLTVLPALLALRGEP